MTTGPPDPFRQIDALATTVAEQFWAFTRAGIPPAQVAVMLGTMLGTLVAGQQQGGDVPA